jgi:hypothetical protein
MIEDANAAIFRGICIGSEPSTTNELSVTGHTTYTFKILEMIKLADFAKAYQKDDTFTFKQAGLNTKWMPRYACSPARNHEYLLFLSCSEDSGLCAPVGVVLGVMNVTRDKDGRAVVRGGINWENRFKGVTERRQSLRKSLTEEESAAMSRTDTSPVPYDEFTSIIRKIEPAKTIPARGTR